MYGDVCLGLSGNLLVVSSSGHLELRFIARV
jgi:hypothetical protein